MLRTLLCLLALTCALQSPSAGAWGAPGHALVAELAQRQLSPEAQAEIRYLLIEEPTPSLAAVASWADTIRGDDGWRWTAPMHYVNFADSKCSGVPENRCRKGLCVTAAIERYQRELGDRRLSRAQRALALKFLVHFIGDAHQPLHAGYRPDRGGNDFQINIDGVGTNLHAVWDSRVLGLKMHDVSTFADGISKLPAARQPFAPTKWAEESCRLIDAINLYPKRPGRLPSGYLAQMRPHATVQVIAAAGRLAQTLELTLTHHPN